MRLTRFANEFINYTFPGQTEGTPYFGATRPQTAQVLGMDGVYLTSGSRRFPAEAATYQAAFFIHNEGNDAAYRAAIDEVYRLLDVGLGRLFSDPGGGLPLRWTWAVVSAVNARELVSQVPHWRLPVQVQITVPIARWYSREDATYAADGTPTVPDRVDDAGPYSNGDTFDLTNLGNAEAQAVIVLSVETRAARTLGDGGVLGEAGYRLGQYGGNTIDPGILRRSSTNQTIQRVFMSGLQIYPTTIDGDERSVIRQNQNAYSDFRSLTGEWITVPPGTNEFEAYGEDGNEYAFWLYANWWDTWSSG